MRKIVVTGSNGKIGTVVSESLAKNHEVVGLDLPNDDISDYSQLLQKVSGSDVLIHLAHATREEYRENPRTGKIDPLNVKNELNVFRVVAEAQIGRLIIASSVHADDFEHYEGDELLQAPGGYGPTSPYGAHKIIVEEMGRYFSTQHGYECIAIRFGGVTRDNTVKTYGREREVWLSHDDLSTAISACVEAPNVPKGFAVFYAVSNNTGRLHSTQNPFGWIPKDDSKDHPSLA